MVFKYLIHQGYKPSNKNLIHAIRLGRLDFIKYLIEDIKINPNENIVKYAYEHGFPEITEYLISKLNTEPRNVN